MKFLFAFAQNLVIPFAFGDIPGRADNTGLAIRDYCSGRKQTDDRFPVFAGEFGFNILNNAFLDKLINNPLAVGGVFLDADLRCGFAEHFLRGITCQFGESMV